MSRPSAHLDCEETSDVIFIVGQHPDFQRVPAHSWILAKKSPVFRAMFQGPMASLLPEKGSGQGQDESLLEDRSLKFGSKISESKIRAKFARQNRNTIAVGDVDGRAFDILLRYLYNERIQLQSVMTALTTLYAAHKYMCPGLAKQVVAYLKENLSDKNVLLVLQHICLYCSGSAENNYDHTIGPETYWNIPVTEPPKSRHQNDDKDSLSPSAPPADQEEDPLLIADEDDCREFEVGMAITAETSGSSQKVKVNCCNALLKQCLELIDLEATKVLGSEDIEDLDISAINMIVCRDTLNIGKESEIFNAIFRWSTRECKRQRLELTATNRRAVLEGSQYLVRYLVMSPDEFNKGPYRSGLLTQEEEEAILAIISGASTAFGGVSLPDHLLQCETIMRTKRRGQNPPHGIHISRFYRSSRKGKKQKNGKRKKDPSASQAAVGSGSHVAPNSAALHTGKDKFNIVEEFFVCLACIFD